MRNSKGQFVKGFGFWTGKKRVDFKNQGTFSKGNIPWNKGVKGKQKNHDTSGLNPMSRKGKKNSPETIAKLKLARAKQKNAGFQKKDKHWNWKGGVTELRKKLQQTSQYREWRTSVFARDNWTCQQCGAKGFVQADHIKRYSVIISENKITTVKQAKKCKELWDVSNGRTLCVPCHLKTDTFGNKVIAK